MDELPVPIGLNAKILKATIGTTEAKTLKASWASQTAEWLRGFSFPFPPLPQLAPVAMMLLFAALFFSQTVSADTSITGIYQKSFELAEQTYKQSAGMVLGDAPTLNNQQKSIREPISGTYVNDEEK